MKAFGSEVIGIYLEKSVEMCRLHSVSRLHGKSHLVVSKATVNIFRWFSNELNGFSHLNKTWDVEALSWIGWGLLSGVMVPQGKSWWFGLNILNRQIAGFAVSHFDWFRRDLCVWQWSQNVTGFLIGWESIYFANWPIWEYQLNG